MATGNQGQSGFQNSSEIFANIIKLIGPSAVIIGPNFYIDRTGAFFYDTTININNPSSGAGHLVGSGFVAPFTGSPPVFDRFGNSILPEFCTYLNTGGSGSLVSQINAINLSQGDLAVRTAPQYNQTFNNTYSSLELGGSVTAALNLNVLALTNPALAIGLNTDPDARLSIDGTGKISWGPGNAVTDATLFRSSAGTMEFGQSLVVGNSLQVLVNTVLGFMSTTQASIAVSGSAPGAIAGSVEVVGSNPGLLFTVAPSGLGQFVSGSSAADLTQTVVTAATTTPIGKQYTIPANDAVVGDTYEFDLQCIGKQGSTQQTITISVLYAGSTRSVTLAAGFAGVSATFSLKAKFTMTINATGAGGNEWDTLEVIAGQSGTTVPQVGIAGNLTGTVGFNTTIANTVQFEAAWGATTGAPTITSVVTRMRKIS